MFTVHEALGCNSCLYDLHSVFLLETLVVSRMKQGLILESKLAKCLLHATVQSLKLLQYMHLR